MWQVFNAINISYEFSPKTIEPAPTIFLYGSSQRTLELLTHKIHKTFEKVVIAGVYSPPYRDLTKSEKGNVIEMINRSGAGIIWIGLGCPKQEKWMMENSGKISGVMVGVGAAFDFYAGNIKRAPITLQKIGLEWLYRLLLEPRRLWRRYLVTNSSFMYQVFKLLMKKIFLIKTK